MHDLEKRLLEEDKRYNPKSKSADHVFYPYGSYTTKPEGIELARAVNRFASLGMEITLDRPNLVEMRFVKNKFQLRDMFVQFSDFFKKFSSKNGAKRIYFRQFEFPLAFFDFYLSMGCSLYDEIPNMMSCVYLHNMGFLTPDEMPKNKYAVPKSFIMQHMEKDFVVEKGFSVSENFAILWKNSPIKRSGFCLYRFASLFTEERLQDYYNNISKLSFHHWKLARMFELQDMLPLESVDLYNAYRKKEISLREFVDYWQDAPFHNCTDAARNYLYHIWMKEEEHEMGKKEKRRVVHGKSVPVGD